MPRPTVRLRMTLLYAGVFLLAGAALLTVSYILVRNNLTADHVSVGSGPPTSCAARSSARWPTTPCTACASSTRSRSPR